MPNRLQHESSPYLLQHASNPVDWHPWGDEAWARAAAEDKPVLLSIGDASCHWRHAMERQALSTELLDQGIIRILTTADQIHGGFGDPPKFPQPWLVELMLRASARGPGGAHGVADLTLRRMARGGIYDQLGGGFHRYAVDGAWRTPHFEKMLYDNALIARLYTHAWQARHDPLFERIAVETLEYLPADLGATRGGFVAGQDAESDGGEGGYYLWSHDQFTRVAPDAAGWFGVTPQGDFEGGLNVLTRARDA